MKKKIFTIIFLIIVTGVFALWVTNFNNGHNVLEVIEADKVKIDLNNNGTADNDETVCIAGLESFKLNSDDKFLNKYAKEFKLSKIDMIDMGYLAREFAIKTLLYKKVHVDLTGKENINCRFASISIDGMPYADLLLKSGFGIKNGKIGNPSKYKQQLKYSKKLNLVILNHHSNIYHKLDCKYGNLAHDKIIIPLKQLPQNVRPCRYCHNLLKKFKKHKRKSKNNFDYVLNVAPPALVVSEGNIALYKFDYAKNLKSNSYCANNVCRLIVNEINKAEKSIDIAIYGYEDIPLFTQSLRKAKARGVKIRFIYDGGANTFYQGNHIISVLSDEVSSDEKSPQSSKLMHNKFIIIDDQKVITGSMNYSRTGMSGYDANDVVIINSKDVANLYTSEFEQMLSGKYHNAKEKHSGSNRFLIGNSILEVYFSPQDKAASRVVELINGAKKYVYVPTFLITHKYIAQALINAHRHGVDVKVIIDANSVNTRNSKHKLLRSNGIPLKAENYAGKLHSKSIVIDDKYLIIGSMNFSNSGENKNDENMLVLTNPDFARNYRNFFLYLWKIIPDRYLKSAPRAESIYSIGSCSDGVDNNFDGKIDSQDAGCKPKSRR